MKSRREGRKASRDRMATAIGSLEAKADPLFLRRAIAQIKWSPTGHSKSLPGDAKS